jgi:hypothetical protein
MITDLKKNEIVSAIYREIQLLGSQGKVANKLGISAATISANLLKADNWRLVSDNMWSDVASVLGVSLVNKGWNLARTKNMIMMHTVLGDAQRERMFMAVSERAGSGKTSSIAAFVDHDTNHCVYFLQCEEWSKKAFLIRLSTQLGVATSKYDNCDSMTEGIVKFFKQRSKEVAPLLVLDEADKLKPAALRFLIPLYNRLEDEIGLVACGTENLEKEIKDGVRKASKGYDEIFSRLGRNFSHLMGFDKDDITAICVANGISDPAAIQRIFEKGNPVRKSVGLVNPLLVEDLRAVKRAVKTERIRMAHAA